MAAQPAASQGDRYKMKITQAFTFEAAHRLPNVPTTHRCYQMHGHSYGVGLELEGTIDPVTGFVVDFFDIENAFAPLLARLDHHCLNELEGLENPTAENIAIWIWSKVKPALPQLCVVTGHETKDCWVEYDGH
jgi:6-pyruvoyltetrahydropterin/6-carboxytetrahydropterin synthase